MTSKKLFYLAGTMMLFIFAGFSYSTFTEALTPYVDYEEAIKTPRNVQVAGGLLAGSSSYDDGKGNLHFTLVDTEDASKTLKVRYSGLKPANFEDAISIVAIGRYDGEAGEFAADDLLVKCPSKYQGIEGYESDSYESKSYGAEGTSQQG
ncbi:MAG: cytochrome c maturation protein CcmE [Acidobacteriota bacterium]